MASDGTDSNFRTAVMFAAWISNPGHFASLPAYLPSRDRTFSSLWHALFASHDDVRSKLKGQAPALYRTPPLNTWIFNLSNVVGQLPDALLS
jgi:hypothetical protein